MRLRDLLSDEICLDFVSDLNIDRDKIKEFIKKWPNDIYTIVINLQKDPCLDHYIYKLPNGDGVLEFDFNSITNKIDIIFHQRKNVVFHRKFKSVLGEAFADIVETSNLSRAQVSSVDEMDSYLATGG